MLRRCSAVIALALLGSAAAAAQENPSPNAVHECTAINDPRLMQECIQRYSGYDSQFAPGAGGDKLLDDRGTLGQESGPPP